MKNLKKLTALVMAVAMVLSLVSLTAFAAEEITPTFTVKNADGVEVDSVKAGNTVTISMSVPKGTYGFTSFFVEYDPDVVELSNLVKAAGLTGNIMTNNNRIQVVAAGGLVPTSCDPVFTVDATIKAGVSGEQELIGIQSGAMNTEGDIEAITVNDAGATVTVLESFVATEAIADPAEIEYQIGTDVVAALANDVDITVTDGDEKEESGYTAVWTAPADFDKNAVVEDLVFTGVVGAPTDDNAASFTSLTVEIKVNMIPLDGGTVTYAARTLEMKQTKESTVYGLADAKEEFGTEFVLTVKKGEIEDTFTVGEEALSFVDLDLASEVGTIVNLVATLTDATSDDGKFVNISDEVTVGTVKIIPAVADGVAYKFNADKAMEESDELEVEITRDAAADTDKAVVITVTLLDENGDVVDNETVSATFAAGETKLDVEIPALNELFKGVDSFVGYGLEFELEYDGASIKNDPDEDNFALDIEEDSPTASKRPGGMGSSTGAAAEGTYEVKVGDCENGTVAVNTVKAKEGDVVTITALPEEGFKVDVISVTKADGTKVAVDNGKFTMPKSKVIVTATFVEGEEETVTGSFADVTDAHWAYAAIEALKEAGIVNGDAEGNFNPEANVTRAEFAKMVVELKGLEATATESAFEDCTAADWYTPYVVAAAEAGYVTGMSDTFFGANEKISRQDICTILGRVIGEVEGVTPAEFTDAADIADYAVEYVNTMASLKIVNGYEDGSFAPNANATRAEAAKIINGVMVLLAK